MVVIQRSRALEALLAKANAPIRRNRIKERMLDLRRKYWPELDAGMLWDRKARTGFITIPRAMPLIMGIMDDLSNGRPVSMPYFDLWCRSHDEAVVPLSKPRELAFHAGFTGQRAETTWAQRIRILRELGFIRTAPGVAGELSYAVILNPYLVIKEHHKKGTPGLVKAKYNALLERVGEIGADDLDDAPVEKAPSSEKEGAASA